MQGPEPAAPAETTAGLAARLEAAERELAERDKTIRDLIIHLEGRSGSVHPALGVMEENAVLQQAIARKTLEIEAQSHRLEQSEQRFSEAFEQAPIGIALVSLNGKWLKVNRALCDLVGYSKDELLESSFQDITHPEDLHLDLEVIRRMMDGEILTYQMEKRYIHADGRYVPIFLNVSLVRDGRARPL